MPAMSGLELQDELMRRGIMLPVIFITGHGDIEMVVNAIQAGARDFLVKPVKEARLFASLEKALAQTKKPEETHRQRLALLSDREHEILRLVLQDVGTHAVAERLGIGERTVQGHRRRIYQKMGLNSTELLKANIPLEWL